ncbi:MAG TPA: sodium:proton antiporter [Vicinamibacterales bacterium]|nr:sodium:proton antiporter [Vicinamibacterales bacterium]
MELLEIFSLLVVLAAVFSYINHRFFRLPTTIGVMAIALAFSLTLVALGRAGLTGVEARAELILGRIDFNLTLMHGMLSFLLFAGALHVNLDDLARVKWIVASLATFGVVVSTLLIGSLTWLALQAIDLELSFVHCLLFGALISPTDPIAVLGVLKTIGVPKSLETKITGESLFNDGVGIVVFLAVLGLAARDRPLTLVDLELLFVQEAAGGILLGLALGWVAYRLLATVDDYQVEILLSLALVMGGYSLATRLHTSGALAVVVAGLLIGNHGRRFAMSDRTRDHLDTFWELVDELMNAVLFVLIGLEVLVMAFTPHHLVASALVVPIVLFARFVAVSVPVGLFRLKRELTPGVVRILTWGGLRGGISIALALSIPAGPERTVILTITYAVVVFSILVQGLTLARVAARLVAAGSPASVRGIGPVG